MSEKITYHIGTAVRKKDGQVETYSFKDEFYFYTRTSADKGLRVLVAELRARGVEFLADEFAIVRRCAGQPDVTFDYWRKPADGLPPEGERVLLYCESKPKGESAVLDALDASGRWLVVIGEWNGHQWVEDRSSKRPPFPVKFWTSIPDGPA